MWLSGGRNDLGRESRAKFHVLLSNAEEGSVDSDSEENICQTGRSKYTPSGGFSWVGEKKRAALEPNAPSASANEMS